MEDKHNSLKYFVVIFKKYRIVSKTVEATIFV